MRTSKYTKEFKDSTVQLALNSDEAVSKIAADLDIHVKTLYNWISIYKKEHNIPMRGISASSSTETADEEIKRLRKENKLLKQERDIFLVPPLPRCNAYINNKQSYQPFSTSINPTISS